MKFQFLSGSPEKLQGDVLVYFMGKPAKNPGNSFAPLNKAFGGELKKIFKESLFSGAAKKVLTLPTYGMIRSEWLVFIGLGEDKKRDLPVWREAGGFALREGKRLEAKKILFYLDEELLKGKETGEEIAQALAEGALLGDYKFSRKSSVKDEENGENKEQKKEDAKTGEIEVVLASAKPHPVFSAGMKRGEIYASAQLLARDISNLPSNEAAPTELTGFVKKRLSGLPLKISVLDEKAIRKEKMNLLLAVSRGSARAPRVLTIEINPSKKTKETVVLIGKGLVFDSGGLSLKPAAGMEEMKHDKSGAAAVIGAMSALAKLKPKTRVVALVGFIENMPDGNATRPGDIIKSRSGLTVQIDNTDAEGRLLLADLLDYARKFKPKWTAELSTLTGACHAALGSEYAGAFTKSDDLFNRAEEAAKIVGEKIWRLPIGGKFEEDVKGKTADLNNVGSRYGGASYAATFLNRFAKGYDYLHLDIAGTAYGKAVAPLFSDGATGYGAKLLVEMVLRSASGK